MTRFITYATLTQEIEQDPLPAFPGLNQHYGDLCQTMPEHVVHVCACCDSVAGTGRRWGTWSSRW